MKSLWLGLWIWFEVPKILHPRNHFPELCDQLRIVNRPDRVVRQARRPNVCDSREYFLFAKANRAVGALSSGLQWPPIGAVYSGHGPAFANETPIEGIVLQDDDLECGQRLRADVLPRHGSLEAGPPIGILVLK